MKRIIAFFMCLIVIICLAGCKIEEKTELHFLKHLLQIARPSALFLKILRNLTDLYIQVPVLLQNYQQNQNIL